jgi:hypothetical protein
LGKIFEVLQSDGIQVPVFEKRFPMQAHVLGVFMAILFGKAVAVGERSLIYSDFS